MSADNTWSGRVTITPPLTWAECKVSPGVEDVKLDIHEEDGPLGRILTAVAVLPARPSDSWSAGTGQELQFLIDSHPGHEFDGYLQVDWQDGWGTPPSRYAVRDRRVVEVKAQIAWPGEPDAALTEARDLAKLALGILDQFPTDPSDFDPSLRIDRLPEWAGGDAETWQRGNTD